MRFSRAAIVVLDGVGCGGAPDAEAFGDEGSDTLGNTAEVVGGLSLPHFAELGLGYVEQSLRIAEEVDHPSLLRDGYELQAKINQALGRYEQALVAHQRFKRVSDEMLSRESSKTTAKLKALYESESKQREIELLRKDRQIGQLEPLFDNIQSFVCCPICVRDRRKCSFRKRSDGRTSVVDGCFVVVYDSDTEELPPSRLHDGLTRYCRQSGHRKRTCAIRVAAGSSPPHP